MPQEDAALNSTTVGPDFATALVLDGKLATGAPGDAAVPWWSYTKTLLAAAALVLVDAGRLTLDAPLAGRRYTLRQLLQHRAGVPEYGALADYHAAVARNGQPWSVAELVERVKADTLVFEPGAGWQYSNVGYLFVRQLIEDAAGADIGTALSRLVLAPLGIVNASLARTPADLVGTRWGNAAGYHPGWVYHGLLIGPPAAACLALDRLMRGALLSSGSLRAMQETCPIGLPGEPPQGLSYGLGLLVAAGKRGPAFMGHNGQGPGSVAAVYHFPARTPIVTAGAFAPADDRRIVERRVVDMARDVSIAQG
jgi:D-alanyl-D-alanine carboxypeptidase